MVAFASSPGRFRFHEQPQPLSQAAPVALASSPARICFHVHRRSLSQSSPGCFRKHSRLLSLAFPITFAGICGCFRKQPSSLSFSQAAPVAFVSRFRIQSHSWSLSQAVQLAFAFARAPAVALTCSFAGIRGRFCQVVQLAFTFASIQGRFRKQLSLLSRAVQLAFAFTSSHSRFRKQPRSLWKTTETACEGKRKRAGLLVKAKASWA